MHAVILAAGEGRRLRPLTEHAPKPMLEVAGKPLLEYNVRLLARYGITDLIINTHYCPESIEKYFGDGRAFGVKIVYSHEPELLGTAGALGPLRKRLTGAFMVLYGDNLTTCNLRALAEFHQLKHAVATLAVFRRENATAAGILSMDADDRIVRFLEKPGSDEIFSSWVNAGIMVCEPAILQAIPAGFSDFGKDVIPALVQARQPIYGYRMDENSERLWWIDSPQDYERTRAEAQQWIVA
jgi:NDP-sugar pyrophosphorylase family protein